MDAAISRYEDPLVNLYWNVLRTLNKSIRLNLAAKLTASVAEEERAVESAVSNPTRAMLDKYYGTWVGNESAADTLRAIRENSGNGINSSMVKHAWWKRGVRDRQKEPGR